MPVELVFLALGTLVAMGALNVLRRHLRKPRPTDNRVYKVTHYTGPLYNIHGRELNND